MGIIRIGEVRLIHHSYDPYLGTKLFTIRASGMVYKLLRVVFRFDEVEPEGVDFDVS